MPSATTAIKPGEKRRLDLRIIRLCLARERALRGDAGDCMLVHQLLLTMVFEDDGEAVESADDAGQPFAADEVHVNGLRFLAKLIKKRSLDVDGTARRFVHFNCFPSVCWSHNLITAGAPPFSTGGTHCRASSRMPRNHVS